jgi:hypothetical protein
MTIPLAADGAHFPASQHVDVQSWRIALLPAYQRVPDPAPAPEPVQASAPLRVGAPTGRPGSVCLMALGPSPGVVSPV